MAKSPGRPSKGRLLKGFHMEPELELRMNRKLTPEGQNKIPHGAVSDLINSLIKRWLDEGDKSGPAES